MMKSHVQIVTLFQKGRLLTTLDNGATYYQLYSIDSFFVEMELEKWTDKIVGRAIFKSGTQIEKYLNQIPVII